MDFLDPKKKRANSIRLSIGYALMAVVLGISTLILVFAAYGYSIDRKTGNVIQNGLIIVDAHPEPATIYVNGKGEGSTDSRMVLPAGQYKIELQRQNYRSWVHDVALEGSSIEQLLYPFLFPTDMKTETVQENAIAPSMASASLDRHWLVMHLTESPASFQVLDITNPEATVTDISLPSDIATAVAGAHSYEAIEWSNDNVNLLVKHNYVGGSEFIVLNREVAAESVNLSKAFAGQTFTSLSLRDKKADQFYLHNAADGSLSQASSANQNVTLLRRGVVNFKSYEANTVLYAATSANPAEAEIRIRRGDQDFLVRTVPVSSGYLLDLAEFKGKLYLVAGSPANNRVYVYQDPFADLARRQPKTPEPFRVLVMPNLQYLSFSAIARFIAVQSGSSFVVYDLENDRQSRYDTALPLTVNQKANWMDGHRLTLTSGGSVFAFDFDGTNLQQLTASYENYGPIFDRDYEALYTFAPNAEKTKTQLLRASLLAN